MGDQHFLLRRQDSRVRAVRDRDRERKQVSQGLRDTRQEHRAQAASAETETRATAGGTDGGSDTPATRPSPPEEPGPPHP